MREGAEPKGGFFPSPLNTQGLPLQSVFSSLQGPGPNREEMEKGRRGRTTGKKLGGWKRIRMEGRRWYSLSPDALTACSCRQAGTKVDSFLG